MNIIKIKSQIFHYSTMALCAIILLHSISYFLIPQSNDFQTVGSITISIGLSLIGLGVFSYIIRPFLREDGNRKAHLVTTLLGLVVMLLGCLIFFVGKLVS